MVEGAVRAARAIVGGMGRLGGLGVARAKMWDEWEW